MSCRGRLSTSWPHAPEASLHAAGQAGELVRFSHERSRNANFLAERLLVVVDNPHADLPRVTATDGRRPELQLPTIRI
jgi:hypothetical protein